MPGRMPRVRRAPRVPRVIRVNGVRVYRRNMPFNDVVHCIIYVQNMIIHRDNLLRIPRLAESRIMFWVMSRILLLEECISVATRRYSRANRQRLITRFAQMCEITHINYDDLRREARILEEELELRGL
uniref:DUF4129 domain-containing protein n=1 Tax=Caenorhabditis tropicalis TaxID=1561998 RepID=A0A1I7URY8_9PELO